MCFPDAIKARGVDKKEDLPTYFYRDDGYLVWEATMGLDPFFFKGFIDSTNE